MLTLVLGTFTFNSTYSDENNTLPMKKVLSNIKDLYIKEEKKVN